jgi:hypothetical protein
MRIDQCGTFGQKFTNVLFHEYISKMESLCVGHSLLVTSLVQAVERQRMTRQGRPDPSGRSAPLIKKTKRISFLDTYKRLPDTSLDRKSAFSDTPKGSAVLFPPSVLAEPNFANLGVQNETSKAF